MKFSAALITFAAVVCVVLADKMDKKEGMVSSSYGGGAAPSYGAPAPSYGAPAPSYSAPPCPKNYLFSCQPSVAPVPCAPAGGYAGAYSEQVPQYLLPQNAYQQWAQQY